MGEGRKEIRGFSVVTVTVVAVAMIFFLLLNVGPLWRTSSHFRDCLGR